MVCTLSGAMVLIHSISSFCVSYHGACSMALAGVESVAGLHKPTSPRYEGAASTGAPKM